MPLRSLGPWMPPSLGTSRPTSLSRAKTATAFTGTPLSRAIIIDASAAWPTSNWSPPPTSCTVVTEPLPSSRLTSSPAALNQPFCCARCSAACTPQGVQSRRTLSFSSAWAWAPAMAPRPMQHASCAKSSSKRSHSSSFLQEQRDQSTDKAAPSARVLRDARGAGMGNRKRRLSDLVAAAEPAADARPQHADAHAEGVEARRRQGAPADRAGSMRKATFLPNSWIRRPTKSLTRPERENCASGPCSE